MKHSSKSGFTIVELVIVIVILGVLATIGFTSYSSYLSGTRDSNRITQISDIKSGLNLLGASKSLPIPQDSIRISADTSLIGYQGYAGDSVLKTIGYTNGGTDPYDNTYFTYFLSKNLRDFQLMAFLEEDPDSGDDIALSISQVQAEDIDYTERFPVVVGKALGILLYTEDNSNTPVQEIPSIKTVGSLDVGTTGSTFGAYYSDDDVVSGTGRVLRTMIPNKDCERLHQLANHKGSGVYKINPTGEREIQVYCDMETDGGGWTKVVKVNKGDILWDAYITDKNTTTFLTGTGGRNFSQFSLDWPRDETELGHGEDLEYMFKVDGVQKGPIYSGVKKEAWENEMGTAKFDSDFFYRIPNITTISTCATGAFGLFHYDTSWNWSISNTSTAACGGYAIGGGFLLTGSSERGVTLYGLNTYNATPTWKNLEIFIR